MNEGKEKKARWLIAPTFAGEREEGHRAKGLTGKKEWKSVSMIERPDEDKEKRPKLGYFYMGKCDGIGQAKPDQKRI